MKAWMEKEGVGVDRKEEKEERGERNVEKQLEKATTSPPPPTFAVGDAVDVLR